MAHDDIWDDSALVDSWNEALAEYKKYHSIHATQGNVDSLLSPDKQQSAKPETRLDSPAESAPPYRHQDAANNVNTTGQSLSGAAITRQDQTSTSNSPSGAVVPEVAEHIQGLRDASGGLSGRPSAMPSPEALLGSVQDEGLKKLLMSWYYAGFYTGLYQGQQSQQSQQRDAQ